MALDDGDLTTILDLIFSHRMDWVQGFLKDHGLKVSGKKDELRTRLESSIDKGKIEEEKLVLRLDRIEGWGNQHIYLYKVGEALIARLSSEQKVKKALEKQDCENLLNQPTPLVLPDEPTLSVVEWDQHHIRFVWIEKRTWRQPVPEEDRHEDDLEFDAYRPMISRGIVSFNCDLVSARAELMIQRLPSGANYAEEKRRFEEELGNFIDVAELTVVAIGKAIKTIDKSPDVRKRSTQFALPNGPSVTFNSGSKKKDAYSDPKVKKSRLALGKDVAGRLGNFYWPTDDGREIHVKLYAKDQRVGIFGECNEQEVRDVLSGVRRFGK